MGNLNLMKTPLSPNDIEVLLHYHTCGLDHPRSTAGAVQESINMFVECNMLIITLVDERGHKYCTTEKGKAFVEALCNTKEPEVTWKVPA